VSIGKTEENWAWQGKFSFVVAGLQKPMDA
jgi:hypothetical protein